MMSHPGGDQGVPPLDFARLGVTSRVLQLARSDRYSREVTVLARDGAQGACSPDPKWRISERVRQIKRYPGAQMRVTPAEPYPTEFGVHSSWRRPVRRAVSYVPSHAAKPPSASPRCREDSRHDRGQ